MRKLVGMAMVMALFLSAPAMAKEYEYNPDHFASLTWFFFAGESDGTTTFTSGAGVQSFESEATQYGFTLILPVSQSVSLSFRVSETDFDGSSPETLFILGSSHDGDGTTFGAAFTYYFNGGSK